MSRYILATPVMNDNRSFVIVGNGIFINIFDKLWFFVKLFRLSKYSQGEKWVLKISIKNGYLWHKCKKCILWISK